MIGSMGDTGSFAIEISDIMLCDVRGRDGGGRGRDDDTGRD